MAVLYLGKYYGWHHIYLQTSDRNSDMRGNQEELLGCPVARTAELIGNKWTPLILRDLAMGQMRFSQLERSLAGISPKTLSERLKKLEEAEVLTRQCYAEVPPRVEYALTSKGTALLPVIETMREFGRNWLSGECTPDTVLGADMAPAVPAVTH